MGILNNVLKIIFPPKCIFCDKILNLGADIDICKECFDKIPFLDSNKSNGRRNVFLNRYCDKVVCVCEYKGIIKEALVKFKFYNRPSFYRALGKLLTASITGNIDYNKFDIVVAVPLYKGKYIARGYNQAQLLAKAISRQLNIADCSAVIRRNRDTLSQRTLERKERFRNIKDAFILEDYDIIQNKTILLVDDVFTTGSTVGECARVLKEAGAAKVVAGVIASGRKY